MATYDVDINLALQGSDRLRALSTALRQVTKDVGKLNAKTIKIGKELDKTFKKSHIENADNYANAVKRAERALRKAAAGTREEREAISMVVRTRKEANAELERQNALLREEERIQGVLQVKASNRISFTSPLSSPVFGARDIEGSPMARDFGFEPKKKRGGAKPSAGAGVTGGKRFEAAVSAGAFPLLFGGGPGMALGGAFGGAISGSTFGAPAIALQVLGGAVDTYVAQLTDLANSLSSTQDILSGLENAGYRVSDATKSVIDSYEEAGLFADAYAIALEEINRVLGPDGAAKLSAYNDETKKLQSEIEKVTASLQNELLPVFTGLIRVILGVKSAFDQFADSPLGKLFLQGGKQIAINLLPGLGTTEKVLGVLQNLGAPTGEPGIPDSVRLAQESADVTSRAAQIEASQAAQERIYLIDAQNKAVQAGNNLLDEQVVTARKNVIQEEYLAKMRKEGITDQEKTLFEREKTLALSRLDSQINTAKLAAQEKQTRELQRQSDAADRERKKAAAAFQRQEEQLLNLQLRGEAQREREVELAGQRIAKYSDQLRLLEAQINGTEDQVRLEIDLANAAGEVEENYVKRIFAAKQTLKQLEEQRRVFEAIGNTIKTGVVDGITAAIDQTRTLGEVASNVLRTIANQLLRLGVNQLFSAFNFGGGGGEGSTGPNVDLVGEYMEKRALGGPVAAGRPYMVGERGPELFVPGAQGNIVPNNAMGSTSVVVNVDASGTEVQGNQGNADQLGRLIGQAVQAELIKQKRPGGLLTR